MINKTSRRRGFTLIEILVVIGIIGLLMAILLPAMEKARESANTAKCAAQLQQIGIALLIYSNENQGQYPRTVYDPAAPLTTGTNPAATDPFQPGGPVPNDLSAALFLLCRNEGIPAALFVDPYDDEVEGEVDPATDLQNRSNFTDYKKNLTYSYRDPYPPAAVATAGYVMTNKLSAAVPLMADLNPGDGPGKNSRMHERRGQNVLYADGHVTWETKPTCGVNGDDIYANTAGQPQGQPTTPNDSVLLPVD